MRLDLAPSVRAFASGMFDTGDGIPADRLDWLQEDVEAFLAHAGPRTTFLFTLVMVLLEWAPPFVLGRPRRFSKLTPKERLRFLERVDASRLAALIAAPKAVLSLCYYEHPEALRETGYDGGCLMGDLPGGTGLVKLSLRRPVSALRVEA